MTILRHLKFNSKATRKPLNKFNQTSDIITSELQEVFSLAMYSHRTGKVRPQVSHMCCSLQLRKQGASMKGHNGNGRDCQVQGTFMREKVIYLQSLGCNGGLVNV